MRLLLVAVLVGYAVVAGGCERSGCPRVNAPRATAQQRVLLDPASQEFSAVPPDTFLVQFETTAGELLIEVVREWAPLGAARFYNLVRHGFYNGSAFFRVIPGFMAQFGVHAVPEVQAAWNDRAIPDDAVVESNRRGTVTFATAGPDTRATQLFINYADNSRLDGMGFAPIGRVVRGMAVADRFFGEYGEMAPSGQGPEFLCMLTGGSAYLEQRFPRLDAIVKATIVAIDPVATFSILGYDPATGEAGGAVQSRVFAVGNGVLWAEAGAGAVATQAIVDVSYGPQALALLKEGVEPGDIVRRIWDADPDPRPEDWSKHGRQFAVINTRGEVAAFTGPRATQWAGHQSCDQARSFCTAQGNILAGEAVVTEMVRAFEETEGHLSFRLLAALEAGQAAGGDTRGMQSAAMLIVKERGGVWLNNDVVARLQVDDSADPIRELRRLVEIAGRQRERIRGTR